MNWKKNLSLELSLECRGTFVVKWFGIGGPILQDTAAGETTHHFIGNISPKSPSSDHPQAACREGWKVPKKSRYGNVFRNNPL